MLTGHSFFPQLISHSFRTGLHDAFLFAIVACLIAARRLLVTRRQATGHGFRSGPAI